MGKHRYQNGQKKRDILAGHLVCCECGEDQTLDRFSRVGQNRHYVDGTPEYSSKCKGCKNEETKRYKNRTRHPQRTIVETVSAITGSDDSGVTTIRDKIEFLKAAIEALERAEIILLTTYL